MILTFGQKKMLNITLFDVKGCIPDKTSIINLTPVIAILYNIHLRNMIRYLCIYLGLPDISDFMNAIVFIISFIVSMILLRGLRLKPFAMVCSVCLLYIVAFGYSWIKLPDILLNHIDSFLYLEYIPGCIMIVLIKDYDRLLSSFSFHGKILLVYTIAGLRKFLTDPYAMKYDMVYGYTALFLGLVFLCAYRMKCPGRNLNLLCSFFCIVTSLIYGSRGVVLIFAIYALFLIHKSKKIRATTKSVIFVLAIMLVLFRVPLANFLYYSVLSLTGLDIIPIKRIGFSLGVRSDIWKSAIDYMFGEMPLFGGGMYIDRLFPDGYVHNLFLELIMDFGIVGLFLAIILLFEIIRVTWRSKSYHEFVVTITIYASIYLFFSSSYLQNQYFWMMSGLMIGESVKNNNRPLSY